MRRPSRVVAAVLSAGAVLVVARALLVVVTVRGGSMEPGLRDGDRVVVVRWRRARRNAVVVCRAPDGLVLPMPIEGDPRKAGDPREAGDVLPGSRGVLIVKRVAAVAGDPRPGGGVIPAGHIYVAGDAGEGLDSTKFGPIPVASLVGPVVGRLPAAS